MSLQGRVKFQVWLLIIVVFALGGVTGASLDRLYMQKQQPGRSSQGGPSWRGRMMDNMKRDLNLSDDQTVKIRTIHDELRKEFQPKRFAECPGFKEMREKTNARIREVLTPEQQLKFDELNARREAETNRR